MAFFGLFMGNEQVFRVYFDNFLSLSPRKSGVHTFLHKNHHLFTPTMPGAGIFLPTVFDFDPFGDILPNLRLSLFALIPIPSPKIGRRG
jgi:hypothetical protein